MKIKQKIKGKSNLKPFKAKGGSMKMMKQLLDSFEIDDSFLKRTLRQKILIKSLIKFHMKITII